MFVKIVVSAGKRGIQMEVKTKELIKVVYGKLAELVTTEEK